MALSQFQTLNKRLAVPNRERHQGVSVTLKRGEVETDAFDARFRGIETVALGAALGLSIRTEMRAWRLPIASVSLGGNQVRPQPNDRITVVGETRYWKVHHPGESIPACERDSAGNDWVVHTQLVNDDNAA